MADQTLREDVWESDRFLDLSNDTQRLAFLRLLNVADDYGNLEASGRRVFRILARCMHVKTEQDAANILAALHDVDLIRIYEVPDQDRDGVPIAGAPARRLIHIPRFRCFRHFKVRKVAPSPWCRPELDGPKQIRAPKQGLAKNATVVQQLSNSSATGVQQLCNMTELEFELEKRNHLASPAVETEPPAEPSAPQQATRQGELAKQLREHGVTATPGHPVVIGLVNAGVTVEQIEEAVSVARNYKPAPTPIPINYFKSVMESVLNPKPQADKWWTTDEGIDRKAREVGIQATGYDSYASLADKVWAKIRAKR
jgi:hypothetical protein